MRVDAARDLDANHLAAEMLAGIHQRARKLAVFEDALLPVNVLQKQVERHHALREAALDT